MARLDYDLDRTVADIRPHYYFNESCQGTVPEAIIAFLDSSDFEGALRNAISLGGDDLCAGEKSGLTLRRAVGSRPFDRLESIAQGVWC